MNIERLTTAFAFRRIISGHHPPTTNFVIGLPCCYTRSPQSNRWGFFIKTKLGYTEQHEKGQSNKSNVRLTEGVRMKMYAILTIVYIYLAPTSSPIAIGSGNNESSLSGPAVLSSSRKCHSRILLAKAVFWSSGTCSNCS